MLSSNEPSLLSKDLKVDDEPVSPTTLVVPMQPLIKVDGMITGEENVISDPSIKVDVLTTEERENVLGMVDYLEDLVSKLHAHAGKLLDVFKGINDRPGVGEIDAGYLLRPILGNMNNVKRWWSFLCIIGMYAKLHV